MFGLIIFALALLRRPAPATRAMCNACSAGNCNACSGPNCECTHPNGVDDD